MRIRGVGVIDDAVLDLSPGLNVLTGETGAGKTMVVSGLGLLLGERADSGLVRTGSASALVEGVVQLPPDHPALVRADEAGADHEDGELVIARTIAAAGRSRAHVGGRTAPVSVLAEPVQMHVAVHGQADQWRLKQGDAHREVLDDFGGPEVTVLRERVADLHDSWRDSAREHARLVSEARERAREIDSLTASLEEIEAVDPQPGEDAALRADDERLHEVGTLVTDLAADLTAYLQDVDLDPERLGYVQERRAALGVLTRKYGETVDEVLEWSGRGAARLDELVTADDRVERLGTEVAELEASVVAAAVSLSEARRAAGDDFGTRVSEELSHLAMGKAVVHVELRRRTDPEGVALPVGDRVRLARHGIDDVEILLAANPGATPRSVARAASGGELSRVMLALEVVGSRNASGEAASGPPTFVFDEVDAGVGGRAALDVGARLAALAEHAQVIVVTHLAQVAAFADRHLVVHKADDGRITSSSVSVVDGDARLRELSRMMGGDPDSEAGLAHAGDLLEQTSGARVGTRPAARSGSRV